MNSHAQRTATSFLLIFTFLSAVFSQDSIESDKKALEGIQKELFDTDDAQRNDIDRREKAHYQKGEFETTAAFEARQKKEDDAMLGLHKELWNQQGSVRRSLYVRMSALQQKEYSQQISLELGIYDADKQIFPLFFRGVLVGNIVVPINQAPEFKQNFGDASCNAKLGIRLNAYNLADDYLVSSTFQWRALKYTLATRELSVPAAMTIAFGNFDGKRSIWTHKVQDLESDDEKYILRQVYATPLKLLLYPDGRPKKVLVTSSPPTDSDWTCHACAMNIGIAVFVQDQGIWKVQQIRKNATVNGSFGQPDTPDIVHIGPSKYAFHFRSYYMGMGDEGGDDTYMEITDTTIDEVLFVVSHEDNRAAGGKIADQYFQNTKVMFRPGRNPEYYDVLLTTTGKKPGRVRGTLRMVPFQTSKLLSFDGVKYTEQQ